ncbi:MAG TPA: hypothetical protein VG389_16610 [Myxococcota bacterium]|nr:hypothetical protein [Myxococcota bacterium]
MIPASMQRYFWDVAPEAVDLETHRRFVVERLLLHGDDAAVTWVRAHYGDAAVAAVVRESAELDGKTARFWQRMLDIPESEVRCLRAPFPLRPGAF